MNGQTCLRERSYQAGIAGHGRKLSPPRPCLPEVSGCDERPAEHCSWNAILRQPHSRGKPAKHECAVAVGRLLAHYWGDENSLQNSVVCPINLVPGRERLLDDLQVVVHPGLQLENHTAIAERF